MRTAYRHGDVVVKVAKSMPTKAKALKHLVLAEGEVTGHKHQITEGEATLYEHEGTLWLQVTSEAAMLTHEEHKPICLPHGIYEIGIQREYEPDGWRNVQD